MEMPASFTRIVVGVVPESIAFGDGGKVSGYGLLMETLTHSLGQESNLGPSFFPPGSLSTQYSQSKVVVHRDLIY